MSNLVFFSTQADFRTCDNSSTYYGIDIETAVNVYLMQVVTDGNMFMRQHEKEEYVRPPFQFGCLKGVFDIDDDFNDVLADFNDISTMTRLTG
jgi:hypothetical protein